jgi:integrase/recombinase XerC
MEASPAWLRTFLDRLAADDLSAATRRGYRYGLLQFIAWYTDLNDTPPELPRLTEHDLITWRQHMMTRGGLKAASINRRLEAVGRLLRWAEANGTVARNVALHVKSVRLVRERRPLGLTAAQVHGLLRAAGASSHGLARRNRIADLERDPGAMATALHHDAGIPAEPAIDRARETFRSGVTARNWWGRAATKVAP